VVAAEVRQSRRPACHHACHHRGAAPRAGAGGPGRGPVGWRRAGRDAGRDGDEDGTGRDGTGRDSVRDVDDCFFSAEGPVDEAGRQSFAAQPSCVGPWSDAAMHGGPPSALLVRACEQAAPAGTPELVALRASIDFFAPVPCAPVEVVARVVRPGRRITLAEAMLSAGGREVLHARVWLVRRLAPDAAPTPELPRDDPPVPEPDACPPSMQSWQFPYSRALEWRTVSGAPEAAGDAAVWARPRFPLVDAEEPSGLQRAVLVADSGNGISAALDWDRWMFVNVDLDVHLARPFEGPWVLLDARTRYTAEGSALATSVLRDRHGVAGAGAQTLVVVPR
jgi:acyl-coenzyme A thioesterase PaaI-like protein